MIPSYRKRKQDSGVYEFAGMRARPHSAILNAARSSLTECILLATTIAIIPMQSNLPKWRGISLAFIFFGMLLVYQFIRRPRIIMRTARHPLALAGYAFIFVILLIEYAHGAAAFFSILRIAFMFLGGVILASFCRGRRAILSGVHGYIVGSVILSIFVVFGMYGKLNSAATTSDFYDVSVARASAFSDSSLRESNLNDVSFFTCPGVILSIVLAWTSPAVAYVRRWIYLALGGLCAMGVMLTMSRNGIAVLIVALAAIVRIYGMLRPRIVISGAMVALIVVLLVPDIVFKRFTISGEKDDSGLYEDSRVPVYLEAVTRFPEYILTGVGMGNFYGNWGRRTGFNLGSTISGAHNVMLQIAINWGLPGLLVYLLIIWRAYKCLPRGGISDPLRLCIVGLVAATLMNSMFMHDLEAKEFSIALGFLIASDLWIRNWGLRMSPANQYCCTGLARRSMLDIRGIDRRLQRPQAGRVGRPTYTNQVIPKI